jgi:hypothetical protein
MKIKYKDTTISITKGAGGGGSIGVVYHKEDPDNKDQNKFFFNYTNSKLNISQLHFKGGMVISPQRMKDTMEDLNVKFKEFQDNGGGTIEDFLNLLTSYERNEKLKQLGI